jgi:hypothetical protein
MVNTKPNPMINQLIIPNENELENYIFIFEQDVLLVRWFNVFEILVHGSGGSLIIPNENEFGILSPGSGVPPLGMSDRHSGVPHPLSRQLRNKKITCHVSIWNHKTIIKIINESARFT